MTLHIQILEGKSLCDRTDGSSITLRWIVRHFRWAIVLISLFGCHDCRVELGAMKVIR